MSINYETSIYNFLMNQFQGNTFAVCGIMGNLKAESNLDPHNLQNSYEEKLHMTDEEYTKYVSNGSYTRDQFINDHAGYGLCQWTYWSRKQGLYDYCKEQMKDHYIFDVNIGSYIYQLEYMMMELKRNKSLYDRLLSCEDVADSAEWFCLEFEKPAGMEKSVPKRIEYALDIWNRVANTQTETETNEEPSDKVLTLKLLNNINDKLDKILKILKEKEK